MNNIEKYIGIYFKETQKIVPLPYAYNAEPTDESKRLVLSAVRNLQDLGFTLSKEAIETLSRMPRQEDIINNYRMLERLCKEQIGADKLPQADVFYPNFPDEVMSMSDYEIYLNAITYYIGEGLFGEDWHQHEEPEMRGKLLESFSRELKLINIATQDDIIKMMHDRAFSPKTLPAPQMKELLDFMNDNPDNWKPWFLSEKITNKENLANISKSLYQSGVKAEELTHMLKDTVDVLRFAAVLSNDRKINIKGYPVTISNSANLTGGPLQKEKIYFRLDNKEAKDVKKLLSETANLYTDIWRRKEEFKALGKCISMKQSTPVRLRNAYDNLCNNKKVDEFGKNIETPEFKINVAIDKMERNDFSDIINTAKAYPGLFSRNFVRMLNHVPEPKAENMMNLADIYEKHCNSIPVGEILKLATYIEKMPELESRVLSSPKNGKYTRGEANFPEMHIITRTYIVGSLQMAAQKFFETPEKKGVVYIDEALKLNKIPGNDMREASEGSVITPGTEIPANPECNIKRTFIWWSGHIDIDSSFTFMDKDMNKIGNCAYYEVKGRVKDQLIAVHSGDFTNGGERGGKGVAEFMDLDRNKALEAGVRYVVASVHVYSGQPFSQQDAKFGIMQREGQLDEGISRGECNVFAFNGQIYEPSTVDLCINLNSEGKCEMPVIYDVEKDIFIWVDKEINTIDDRFQNAAGKNYTSQSRALLEKYTHDINGNMYDLFTAYADGKAERITKDIKEADLIFTAKPIDRVELGISEYAKVVTANDLSEIRADYMSKDSAPINTIEEIIKEKKLDEAILSQNIELTKNEEHRFEEYDNYEKSLLESFLENGHINTGERLNEADINRNTTKTEPDDRDTRDMDDMEI